MVINLVEIYENYRSLNNKLQEFLEEFIRTEEVKCEDIKITFEDVKVGIEQLLETASTLVVDEEYDRDLKDLKYLLTDTLFLLMDLINFCTYNELGRCQMRAINYLGKRKRVEVFGQ